MVKTKVSAAIKVPPVHGAIFAKGRANTFDIGYTLDTGNMHGDGGPCNVYFGIVAT